jgi:tetratricopeptide (TPR) repeat protein
LLLLSGEAGIGKTRLAEEVEVEARHQGMLILWGRCWEGGGAPAFWPWLQIVRAYLQQCPPETLATDFGSGAPHIARVIPEVQELVPSLPALPPLEPDDARFAFLDSLTTFLKRTANHTPLLLILDDLHWSDSSSLLLLQFLVREIRDAQLLILGLYRDREVDHTQPLAAVLGPLTREGQRITLHRLTETDIAQLITTMAGVSPNATLVANVSAKTAGNPFCVIEVVRLLAAEGRLASLTEEAGSGITIPPGVRELFHRRLDRLSAPTQRLLTAASVIGQEFDLDILAHLLAARHDIDHTDTGRQQLLSSLDEALAAQVLVAHPDHLGRYRFVHALTRETLYERLSLFERTSLHQQVGEAIEACRSSALPLHFVALAEHFRKAALGTYAEKAVHYATLAGERAAQSLAYEEAVLYYEHALQLLPQTEDYEEQRCERLLALGEVQSSAGVAQEARQTFLQAAAIAQSLLAQASTQKSAFFLARAALGLSKVWLVTGIGVVDEPLYALLEEARRSLGFSEGPLQAKVIARLAAESYSAASYEQRRALSHSAIDMARRLGDASTLAYTLCASHWALWTADNVDQRVAVTSEIVALAEQSRDQVSALVGRTWRAIARLELAKRAQADHDIDAVSRLADELRQPLYRWWALGLQTTRALLEGRFTEVETLAQEQLAVGQRVQAPDAIPAFGVQMALLRREQGRLPEMEIAFRTFVDQYPTVPAWRCGLAGLYNELGDAPRAREEFERAAAHDLTDLPRDPQWLAAIAIASEVCAFLGDTRRAALWYEVLLPYAARLVVIGSGTACLGSVSYFLALLAATCSRGEEAERHFEDAIRVHERIHATPLLVRTQYEFARLLLLRNEPNSREKARALLRDALRDAHDLSMTAIHGKISLLSQSTFPPAHARAIRSHAEGAAQITPQDTLPASNLFRSEGEYWTVSYEGVIARVRATKGFHHLACLLREPGREFHVFDLLAMTDQEAAPARESQRTKIPPRVFSAALTTTPDPQARASYRHRLQTIQAELVEAEQLNDLGRLSALQAEEHFLTQELAASYQLGQHARVNKSELEKARKAVAYRIRAALEKIKKANPALWRHFHLAIKTGVFCSYHPEKPLGWLT